MRENPKIYWKMLKQPTHELAGCTIVYTGIQSPWLNGVIAGVPEDIEQIVSYFKEQNMPFCWWSDCSEEPRGLKDELEKFGVSCIGEFAGMTLDLKQLLPLSKQTLQIERVHSLESHLAFMKVLTEVYEAPESMFHASAELFWKAGVSHPTYNFVGKVNGIAISVVSLFVDSEGVASVFNMGTLPSFRKQGYASELLQSALQQVQGASHSALIATPEGMNLYSRLGFKREQPFHLYMCII